MTWRIETEQWTANVLELQVGHDDDRFFARVAGAFDLDAYGRSAEEARSNLLQRVQDMEDSKARLLAPGKLTSRELAIAEQVIATRKGADDVDEGR